MGKVNKSSHVTEIHKIPECGGYLMYILVLVYTNLDENLLPAYNPVFDSLLSIKTAVDQYLWVFQRFCLLF